MFPHLHLIIPSIFTQFNSRTLLLVLFASIGPFYSSLDAAQQDWTLSGTILADEYSQAMFINENGVEVLLTLGDKIQGCQLMNVHRDSAKLRCDDQTHTLLLRHSIGDLSYDTSHTQQAAKQKIIALSKNELKDYIKQKQRVASEIGFLPLLEGDKVVGFTVSKVRPNTAVSALSLYNGDVITSINGVLASDTSQFLHAISELAMSPQVTIEVDRYGQRHAYTYILE